MSIRTHKGSPEKIGWLKIVIAIIIAFFILAFVAGCYNSWWISTHCTTIVGTLVC